MECNCCGNKLAALGTALAIEIAQGLTAKEMNILGSLFTVIGDQLSLMAATAQAQLERCDQQKSALGNGGAAPSCETGEGEKLSFSAGGQSSSGQKQAVCKK